MNIWDTIILEPVINVIIALSHYLWGSFGLAIIVLTLVIRSAMLPLTLRQLRASQKMQELQSKMAELQKKYSKDREKLAQEQMRLYRESGVSPIGCLLPMLIQMPIWIALYQAIIKVSAVTPESFLSLSDYLYSWPVTFAALPVDNQFLWLNLGSADMLLAILVGASMWLQQKVATPHTTNPQQQQQAQMMTIMMPLMFTFVSISVPSGLPLYWLVSNLYQLVMQYFMGTYRISRPSWLRLPQKAHTDATGKSGKVEYPPTPKAIAAPADDSEEESDGKQTGSKREISRGGSEPGIAKTKRHPGRGKSHRS